MKNTREEEIEELLTIIPRGYPALDIFHLSNNCDGLCQALYNLTQKEYYSYDLQIENIQYFQEIKKKCPYFHAEKFDIKKHRYNKHAKVYDFVFVDINLEKIEDKMLFLKKIYAIIKNGGKILFITDKNTDLRDLEERLIENNYVAVNPISNTFKEYLILSAQKMHGWGN